MQPRTDNITDFDAPIPLAEGVHWVGTHDAESGLNSAYLIVDESGEAVLIDGGSRSDFAMIVMKIMQSGVIPSSIRALIYQNYNPRLWGNRHHLEAIINQPNLRVISDAANLMFVQRRSDPTSIVSLDEMDLEFRFSSGRRLHFVKTPFAHSPGSFMTFDEKTGVLFTGDLFSSYASNGNFFLNLRPRCRSCNEFSDCPFGEPHCSVGDILDFHMNIMSSERALKFALERIAELPFKIIAPQHGCILANSDDIVRISELLTSLKGVGIDGIIGQRSFQDLGDTTPIRERLLGHEPIMQSELENVRNGKEALDADFYQLRSMEEFWPIENENT